MPREEKLRGRLNAREKELTPFLFLGLQNNLVSFSKVKFYWQRFNFFWVVFLLVIQSILLLDLH
jgi:hypothetical protein